MATNIKLKSFENMFKSTDPERLAKDKGMVTLSSDKLVPFKEHPFKEYSEDKMAEMVESIKQHGVLSPVIIRKLTDENYEILSGHNRVSASKLAGLDQVPVIIVEADDDSAMLMMVESNLNQRENILPSERGKAYKLQLEALCNQGKRTDLTSYQNGTKSGTAQEIADRNDLSRQQLFRFIRLTELIPELSDLVDNNKLNFTYGVDLSYLTAEHQLMVYELLEEKNYSLNSTNVGKMKELAKSGKLTDKLIKEVMRVQKQDPSPSLYKKVDKAIKQYKLPVDKAVTIIEKALELYCQTDEFKSLLSASK